jgi:radical SAM protein with 4Fe4S-binding SPASM domain
MGYKDETEISDFQLWDKKRKNGSLFAFDIELTARCNNDCRHCYINLPAGDEQALKKELSIEEIASIADQAIELGALWALLSGGEPLLRADFKDIYLMLKRKGLLVSVFTNATLIREEHVAMFRKYPPRVIEITVYGVTEQTYEKVTGRPGGFQAFMRGLNLLIDGGVKLRLKAMAMQSNAHELPAIAAFCRQYTKDYFRFDPQLHLRFDRDEVRNQLIRSERLSPEQIVALEQGDAERFTALQQGCSKLIVDEFAHTESDHLFYCSIGEGECNISYDGIFRVCSSLWAAGTTADLRKTTLREAWQILVPKVLGMRSQRAEYLENCRICPIVNLCLWCPAHAELETGELDLPVLYFCRVAEARAEAISKTTGDSQP